MQLKRSDNVVESYHFCFCIDRPVQWISKCSLFKVTDIFRRLHYRFFTRGKNVWGEYHRYAVYEWLRERLYLFCVPTRFTIFFNLFSVLESHDFCHRDVTFDQIRGCKSVWGTLIVINIGSDRLIGHSLLPYRSLSYRPNQRDEAPDESKMHAKWDQFIYSFEDLQDKGIR